MRTDGRSVSGRLPATAAAGGSGSPGPDGVKLVARIPGGEETVTGYPDQDAADAAARTAYARYQADVETALSGHHRPVQEAS